MGIESLGWVATEVSIRAGEAVSTDPTFFEALVQFSWNYALPTVAGYYLLKNICALFLINRLERSSKRAELDQLTADIADAKRLGYIPKDADGLVMGASIDPDNGAWIPEVTITHDKIIRLLS